MLAPIALFVYNRPWHTRKTLEALAENELADQSVLYVFCDGPKENATPRDLENIQEVRDLVQSSEWCGEVKIIQYKINQGLAKNIVNGVTDVVNKYGKIIVLEDDIITSPGFLRYMNDALDLYLTEERVMHISGYMFPVKKKLPDTFFYNTASCWGWGTWKRAWKDFNTDAEFLLNELLKRKDVMRKFNIEGSYPFEQHLRDNAAGKLNTWAIKWYTHMFLNDGFALHPYPSLVNNIGHDGEGENCSVSSYYTWDVLPLKIKVQKQPIKESSTARTAMINFYSKLYKPKKARREQMKLKVKQRIKLFLPPIIVHLLRYNRKSKNNERIQSEREKLVKEISNIPRFQQGVTYLFGEKFRFVDSASFLFIYDEIFQKEIYKFKSNSHAPYIIDAGANIGLGILYFKNLFPNAEIVGFEPDDKVFQVLEENIKSFKFSNVTMLRKALWKVDTTLEFYSEGADAGRVAISNDLEKIQKVEACRLRPFINERKVDFLKMDIEGAETEVLEDCKDLLKNVENIFVEYHSFIEQEQSLARLLAILKDAGFRLHVNSPGLDSKQPLVKRNIYSGMDMQLNIYGYRN